MRINPALLLLAGMAACQPAPQTTTTAPAPEPAAPVLTEAWVVTGLKTPESILFDATRNVIYVSNINGNPTDKDKNGSIARISPEGQLLDSAWVTGLDAPKGMAIVADTLYVTDINDLVAIDLKAGKVLKRYPAEGSKFLNDVAADAKGQVYISDSYANTVYTLTGGKVSVWSQDSIIDGPNGLYMNGDTLLMGNKGTVLAFNLTTGVPTVWEDSSGAEGATDGLVPDGNGGYFTSNWVGTTWYIHPGRKPVVLMNTTEQKINSADLETIPAKKLLLVPTFFDNRVVAYTWK
ncbi:MAG: PQQ-binding-like beta-propeller repeat protein [Bacteroidia bacterium]|nr:PQQ-binding-like beta-propeller repeat protein [Bacteroidia bacterium]